MCGMHAEVRGLLCGVSSLSHNSVGSEDRIPFTRFACQASLLTEPSRRLHLTTVRGMCPDEVSQGTKMCLQFCLLFIYLFFNC